MSYNIGDKFIVEIDRIYSSAKNERSRYGIKGFSCLIFDDYGLRKLEDLNGSDGFSAEDLNASHALGMEEAWGAASDIIYLWFEVCFQDAKKFNDLLGLGTPAGMSVFRKFFGTYGPQEAIDLLKKLKKKSQYEREIKARIDDGEICCNFCEYQELECDEEPCAHCKFNHENKFKLKYEEAF